VRIFSVTGSRGADRLDPLGVAHQGRAGIDAADLLRRAAQVDVDDLGALFDVEARRGGHSRRIVPGNLHRDRPRLAGMVAPQAGLLGLPERGVVGGHFGKTQPRAQRAAEHAERAVGDARHRRQPDRVVEHLGGQRHVRIFAEGRAAVAASGKL
jgi:hypothetical protein